MTLSEAATTGSQAPESPLPSKRRKEPSQWIWRLLSYLTFLLAWQVIASYFIPSHIVPDPETVVREIIEIIEAGDIWTHFGATVQRTFIAMTILFALGSVIGILMGLSRWWEAFFRDWINMLLSIPSLIFILVSALIFGLNPAGPIIAIVITVFPFVTVQVWEGVKSLPRELTDMSSAFRVDRQKSLRHVVIPALAPFFFTALTYSLAIAWKIAMLSEIFGSNKGVGFMMRVNFGQYNMEGLLAWALLFYAFVLFIDRAILLRQADRFFRWRAASFR